jgi:uncharacterized tellurite resistance protein B-like protein
VSATPPAATDDSIDRVAGLAADQRDLFFQALLTVASADERTTREEVKRLRAIARALGVRMRLDIAREFDLETIAACLTAPARKPLIDEMVAVARCSGSVTQDEADCISFLCERWGIHVPPDVAGAAAGLKSADARHALAQRFQARARARRRALARATEGVSVPWMTIGFFLLAAAFLGAGATVARSFEPAAARALVVAVLPANVFLAGLAIGALSPARGAYDMLVSTLGIALLAFLVRWQGMSPGSVQYGASLIAFVRSDLFGPAAVAALPAGLLGGLVGGRLARRG